MKLKSLLPSLLLPVILFTGCVIPAGRSAYSDPANWVICDYQHTNTDYDIFYIYPTLAGKASDPEMEWITDPALRKKIIAFSHAQTYDIFGKNVRVFVPYLHQLTYASIMKITARHQLTKTEWTAFQRGMEEAQAAFRYYLKHFNRGRPFILVGHCQGAMDLYYVLEHCPEITVKNGFVAAYLPGLPHISVPQIRKDFDGRIKAAQNADDVGVIAVWNTQNREATSEIMTGNWNYCINPLTWSTDLNPAGPEKHLRAYFYDYRDGSTKEKSHMIGARIDRERGALIVDLPSDSDWDAKAFMGKGIFHMNDIWFFAGNIRANAEHRVQLWKKDHKK